MSFSRVIPRQNNFALAIALHCALFLWLVNPPNFAASEPVAEPLEAVPSAANPTNGASGSVTNSEPEAHVAATEKHVTNKTVDVSKLESIETLKTKLAYARELRVGLQPAKAEPLLVVLLADENPEAIQQGALLELSLVAQDENELPRAQQIYAQFLSRWPTDARAPEILLREGQLFRQMGLNSMALAKFYAVMTAALALKSDQLDYYKKLVMQAQAQIAETHFQMGKYADAAEYFSRLLKQNSPLLDRAQAQYRLVRALAEIGRHDEAVSQARDFLTRFTDTPERPEVHFALARSLKELGRNNESLQQVLALLQEEKAHTTDHPEVWAYWQQRAGNEIANQLYREGDYTRALDVYLSLAQLDRAPSWQLPVNYQIGMTYEHLQQPKLASQTYSNILTREIEVGTNASPGLKSVFDMARWRINFLDWQNHIESATREFASPVQETTASTTKQQS